MEWYTVEVPEGLVFLGVFLWALPCLVAHVTSSECPAPRNSASEDKKRRPKIRDLSHEHVHCHRFAPGAILVRYSSRSL
jgi:hypothetical protein